MPLYRSRVSVGNLTRIALAGVLVGLLALHPRVVERVLAQGGSLDSTITLQMPFIAGEVWTVGGWAVGGGGYFYGQVTHTNAANDYYATDWNRANDFRAAVLPVASGTVTEIRDRPCPDLGYGCYVDVAHADGYLTRYAHLDDVLVTNSAFVNTWDLIGLVGDTGGADGVHLHLTFRHFDSGSYYSKCWNNGQTCPNGELPQQPQGYRPSPMMTASGPATLVDGGTYTSVNGRVYVPDLRHTAAGWSSDLLMRNDGTVGRVVTATYRLADGMPSPGGWTACYLAPNGICLLPMNVFWGVPPGAIGTAYVDGGEAVTVLVVQHSVSPEAWAGYAGVREPSTSVHVPLLHKNNYGYYSELFIQNNGPAATSVTVEYRVSPGQSGANCTQNYDNVPALGLKLINLGDVTCIGSTFVGSAYITNSANWSLVVASTQRKSDNSSLAETSHAARIANTSYGPLIQNNNFGWISGIALQNASGSTNNLSGANYNQGGTPCRTDSYSGTGARLSHIVGSPGGACTSVASAVYSGGSLPVAAIINQVLPGTPKSMDYETVAIRSQRVIVPLWRNNHDGWISGMVIQNSNPQSANVTITYFDVYGAQTGSPVNLTVGANASYVVGSAGVGFGSAVITSNRLVGAVVNHSRNVGGDGAMSQAGSNR